MLARVAPPSRDFAKLAHYLIRGRSGTPTNDARVAWTTSHNLPIADPLLAARCMSATAHLSARTLKPVYHLMIAWHPDEQPDPETMQIIARLTLERAELAEHEALIMGHGDTDHAHLHMMINRVHPETAKAWQTRHDYARFDKIMRELSDEYGFRYAPAHRYAPVETDHMFKKPDSPATYAARRGANTNRLQTSRKFSRALGQRVSEGLTHASSWDDIDQAFVDEGYQLEAKGSGLIVSQGDHYAKFSSLQLDHSAKDLERRFSLFQDWQTARQNKRAVFDVDGVDIVRALMAFGLTDQNDLQHAIDDAVRDRRQQTSTRWWSRSPHVDQTHPTFGDRL